MVYQSILMNFPLYVQYEFLLIDVLWLLIHSKIKIWWYQLTPEIVMNVILTIVSSSKWNMFQRWLILAFNQLLTVRIEILKRWQPVYPIYHSVSRIQSFVKLLYKFSLQALGWEVCKCLIIKTYVFGKLLFRPYSCKYSNKNSGDGTVIIFH